MNNTEILYIKCPTCQKVIEWNEKNTFRPFCTKRCQLIDLGEWANETHRITSAPSNQANDLSYPNDDAPFDKDHE